MFPLMCLSASMAFNTIFLNTKRFICSHTFIDDDDDKRETCPDKKKRKESSKTLSRSNLSPMKADFFKEENGNYTLLADLPGYSKENINVEVIEKKTIRISAKTVEFIENVDTKASEKRDFNLKWITKERHLVPEISRMFTVQNEIDETTISATFENGVLAISFRVMLDTVSESTKIQIQ